MKPILIILTALALNACSRSDQDLARQRAHEAGEKLKKDAREVGHEARADAHALARELDSDLQKGREKIRQKINEHSEPDRKTPDKRP